MTEYNPGDDGWHRLARTPLPADLGVPWSRRLENARQYGLMTNVGHANPSGFLHGGVLMAFADHGLSLLAWEAAERMACTTIQLNTHFLDSVQPGEFLALRPEVTRLTRGLVFVRGLVSARLAGTPRDVAAVDGVWRILRPK